MDLDLRDYLAQMEERTTKRFEAMEERVKQLISDTANRTDERFDWVQKRFDTVDSEIRLLSSRIDRLDGNIGVMMTHLSVINKGLTDHDQQIAGTLSTQTAMQKALNALADRLRDHRHDNGSSKQS